MTLMLLFFACLTVFIAGSCWGVHEKISHHWNQFHERFPRLNPKFWNPAISWENKYRNWPDDKRRTWVPVFFTDAKHFLVSICQIMLVISGALFALEIEGGGVVWWWICLQIVIYFVSYTVGNLLTFNWLY